MSGFSRFMVGALAGGALVAAVALPVMAFKNVTPYSMGAIEPTAPHSPASASRMGFTSTEKQAIGAIARDYMLENPEILQEMATLLQAREGEKQAALRQRAFVEYNDTLYNSQHQTVLGNPEGDVTIVEFFDYNCGYCRSALKDMENLLAKDKNLRVILKEYPVLGNESHEVAKVSAAIRKQGLDIFSTFHHTIMNSQEHADGTFALKAAADAGADMDKLTTDLADPSLEEGINESLAIGQRLGIDGTPSYVVGQTVLAGAVGEDRLFAAIKNMRVCMKAQCP